MESENDEKDKDKSVIKEAFTEKHTDSVCESHSKGHLSRISALNLLSSCPSLTFRRNAYFAGGFQANGCENHMGTRFGLTAEQVAGEWLRQFLHTIES